MSSEIVDVLSTVLSQGLHTFRGTHAVSLKKCFALSPHPGRGAHVSSALGPPGALTSHFSHVLRGLHDPLESLNSEAGQTGSASGAAVVGVESEGGVAVGVESGASEGGVAVGVESGESGESEVAVGVESGESGESEVVVDIE